MPVEIVKLYSFKNKILLQNKQLASQFNEYFGQIIDSLELYDYPCNNIDGLVNVIDCVMLKFTSHLSIKNIKQNFTVNEKFIFREFTVNEVERVIKKLPKNSYQMRISNNSIYILPMKNSFMFFCPFIAKLSER